MPPKRQRKKKRSAVGTVESKAPLVGSFAETLSSAPAPLDPLQCLAMLKQGIHPRKFGLIADMEEYELIAAQKSETESKDTLPQLKVGLALLKNMVRTMFKADHPYRTRLGRSVNVATNASGVLNYQFAMTDITNAGEWSSIDALFDEFFIHSAALHFQPYNRHGGSGVDSSGGTNKMLSVATASSVNTVSSCGVHLVSLFNGAGYYTTATAMLSNPTCAIRMSDQQIKYVWRNNTRFDPRGPALSSATTEAWQGWTLVTNATNYGGTVQMRTAADTVLGDTTHAWNPFSVAIVFDVSFRSRA